MGSDTIPPGERASDGMAAAGAVRARYTLDELLAKVTEDNTHKEFDWGKLVGREVR